VPGIDLITAEAREEADRAMKLEKARRRRIKREERQERRRLTAEEEARQAQLRAIWWPYLAS
jgi:hypothetical protein